MTTNKRPFREPAHTGFTRTVRVQRLWIDGHDRWVSLPRRDAEQDLQEHFGDWRAALALMRRGVELHTRSARYRAVVITPTGPTAP